MEDIHRAFFQKADRDGSGSLSFSEISKILLENGYSCDEQELASYFNLVDSSGDRQISFEEYTTAMNNIPKAKHSTALLKCAFRAFDTDGNGQIDRAELANVFKSVNKQFSSSEIDNMMATVDTDKSGTLNYEEFIAAVEGKLLS